ncbi:hypothetical protein ACJJTC_010651 [Scirpophaga incertulas]
MIKVVVLLGVLALTQSHDLAVGKDGVGKKIFDENRAASPTIWQRADNITVNATDNEVISRIVVTDLRPEKDGEVKIAEGGEGAKTVTLELKSPSTLRGYDFHIQVYAAPEGQVKKDNQDPHLHPSQTRVQRNPLEPENLNPGPAIIDSKKISTTTQKTNDFSMSTDINVNEKDKTHIETNAENVNNDKLKTNISGHQTATKFENNVPAVVSLNRQARAAQIKEASKVNGPQTSTTYPERSIGTAFNPIVASKDDEKQSSAHTLSTGNSNFNVNKKVERDTKHEEDTKLFDNSSTQQPINNPRLLQDKSHDQPNVTARPNSGVTIPPTGFFANPVSEKTKRQTDDDKARDTEINSAHKEVDTKSKTDSRNVFPHITQQNSDNIPQIHTDGKQNVYNPPSHVAINTEKKDVEPKFKSGQQSHTIEQKPVIST